MRAADFLDGFDAAVALLLGRPGALARFDVSTDGFWRSFAAILLVLPSFGVSVIAEGREHIARMPIEAGDFPWLGFALSRFVMLGVDWVALPVVLALIAGRLGVSGRYGPYIVVRNWASVVIAALYAVPALLSSSGVAGIQVVVLLNLALLVIVLHYLYRIARQALLAPVGMAVAIVVLDLVLSLVIGEAVSRVWPA